MSSAAAGNGGMVRLLLDEGFDQALQHLDFGYNLQELLLGSQIAGLAGA